MSIRSIELSVSLRAEGKRLGRAGLAERVFCLVDEFNRARTYKNAIALAGRLKAISQACKYDGYWDEKCTYGFESEVEDIKRVSITGTLPGGTPSRWIETQPRDLTHAKESGR